MFSKTLAAAAIVAPFFARTVLAGDCVRTVTVKEGDTCDSISAAENVSTYQFAIINEGLIDETCSNLIAGQDYCIGYEAEDCSDVWVVEAQQTCDDITGVMAIEMSMLQENNPQLLDDCSNLYVGEVLCVANSALHPPASGSYVPAATVPATATAAASATPTYSEEPAPTTSSEEPAPTTSSEEAPATTSAAAFVDDGYDENDESTWPYCDEL
ncbi:hypothetical protein BD626DRAFT_465102 [Schizophyllum amplum]|uniref:LysM domain-containing protein n=1 Tax=Schizophyllum amplum TaxID=97359 RepID=A0A550BY07_9AGAR|nr:hypothetical protein BD626DRAFT_465102 [Auriculariopsis ampla]